MRMTSAVNRVIERLSDFGAWIIDTCVFRETKQIYHPIKDHRIYYCPGCDDLGVFPFNKGAGIWLGEHEYCPTCAGEKLDLVVSETRQRLLRGPLRWGEKHYLAVREYPLDELVNDDADVIVEKILKNDQSIEQATRKRGIYIMDVVCYCGKNNSRIDLFRSSKQFNKRFQQFCLEHYDQLKPLVT